MISSECLLHWTALLGGPSGGKTRGLDLKQEGEFTEVIADQNIQPAIHVEVVHHNPLPGLLWHLVSLQWLFGRLRSAYAFLAPPCVVCYGPHPALANIGVDEHSAVPWWLREGPGGVSKDTPHGGRTEWQFWGQSGAVPCLWRAGLWSPSTPWPSVEYASFDVATPAEWAGRPYQENGVFPWWYPWVWLSRSCWRQCNGLSYLVWFPQKLMRGTCSVHLQAAFPSLVCIWWSHRITVTAGAFAGVGGALARLFWCIISSGLWSDSTVNGLPST